MGGIKFCFAMPFHIVEGRFGGAEVQAWLLAKELARRGYGVSYIAQSVKGKKGQQETIDGVTVRWVKYAHHFRWSNGLDYYRALKALAPDIVVQRMTSFITGVAGLYCRRYKKKFVWVCTDNSIPYKWHFWSNQRRTNRSADINPIKGAVFLMNAFIYDVSRHWGMKQVTHAFTQNEEQKKALKDSFSLDSYRMVSGHEGPLTVVPPKERLGNGLVLWVANLAPRKRPEKFIELAHLCQDTSLRFIMIGGRSEQRYVDELFRNKPGNIEWLNKLPFEEALSWFDQAAFFVNTSSLTGEGFPNTFIQAWLRGVPVLTQGVDPDDVITRNSLGFVEDSVKNIFQRIQFLRDNPDEYTALSQRVIDYACANHSVEVMTEIFLKTILNTG